MSYRAFLIVQMQLLCKARCIEINLFLIAQNQLSFMAQISCGGTGLMRERLPRGDEALTITLSSAPTLCSSGSISTTTSALIKASAAALLSLAFRATTYLESTP